MMRQLLCRHSGVETQSISYWKGSVKIIQVVEKTCTDCGKDLRSKRNKEVAEALLAELS